MKNFYMRLLKMSSPFLLMFLRKISLRLQKGDSQQLHFLIDSLPCTMIKRYCHVFGVYSAFAVVLAQIKGSDIVVSRYTKNIY